MVMHGSERVGDAALSPGGQPANEAEQEEPEADNQRHPVLGHPEQHDPRRQDFQSVQGRRPLGGYTRSDLDILGGAMAKHLVDIDERALVAAKNELGTRTLKDTVNEALRRVAPRRDRRMARALDTLAKARLADRSAAWR
jgi:Arc/MetJ family transcription regulator